ncbi:TVP38/TMEM64 family protein [Alphaproteobacteria bacterium]|nr:TVP38/TMEM64 family protein [Alphaproteobacteria bacterium]
MSDNNKDVGNAATSLGKRLALIGAFAALIAVFFAYDLDALISYQGLAENEAVLKRAVADNRLVTILAYMAVYITAVTFSLPGALWLSLAGGLMFGTWAGGLIIIFAATIGASGLFVAARYIVGDALRARAGSKWGPSLQKFEAAFNRDAWSYMLILRLLPIFPFFIVNLGAALVGVRFPVFLLTTFFGIMPGTFVFASIGNGISVLLQAGQQPDLSVMTDPQILGPLVALALLSLAPVLWRKLNGAKEDIS